MNAKSNSVLLLICAMYIVLIAFSPHSMFKIKIPILFSKNIFARNMKHSKINACLLTFQFIFRCTKYLVHLFTILICIYLPNIACCITCSWKLYFAAKQLIDISITENCILKDLFCTLFCCCLMWFLLQVM